MSYCVKCIVKGQVQGVFYRASTQEKARQLHLKGHAYNILNGDVEVVACGKRENVKQLQQWLWDGPVDAIVEDVNCEFFEGDVLGEFITG
jgi:acylphosphatase